MHLGLEGVTREVSLIFCGAMSLSQEIVSKWRTGLQDLMFGIEEMQMKAGPGCLGPADLRGRESFSLAHLPPGHTRTLTASSRCLTRTGWRRGGEEKTVSGGIRNTCTVLGKFLSFHFLVCKEGRRYPLSRGLGRMTGPSACVVSGMRGNHSINGSHYIIISLH